MILIFGHAGTGLKTLARALVKLVDSSKEVCIVSTGGDIPMGNTVSAVANDQTLVDGLVSQDRIYEDFDIDDIICKYEPDIIFQEDKEQFYLKNQTLKSVPTIKSHRVQTRNNLKYKFRTNEKPQS